MMKKYAILLMGLLFYFGCGDNKRVTPTNITLPSQSSQPTSTPGVSEITPPSKVEEWISKIKTTDNLEALKESIFQSSFQDWSEKDLRTFVEKLYDKEGAVLLDFALEHKNEAFREACAFVLIKKGNGEALAQQAALSIPEIQSTFQKVYRPPNEESRISRETLVPAQKRLLGVFDLLLKHERDAGTNFLARQTHRLLLFYFNEVKQGGLATEEEEQILKDCNELGLKLINVESSDRSFNRTLAATYYLLAKLQQIEESEARLTYLEKCIRKAEDFIAKENESPDYINIAELYFEKAKVLVVKGEFERAFDTALQALNDDPNRRDIHEFLVRKILVNPNFKSKMEEALVVYKRAVPYILLDLVKWNLNEISLDSMIKPQKLEEVKQLLTMFEKIFETCSLAETLKAELKGESYLLAVDWFILLQNTQTYSDSRVYFWETLSDRNVREIHDGYKKAISVLTTAGAPIPQKPKPFSHLLQTEGLVELLAKDMLENKFKNNFQSPLEMKELKDHIVRYQNKPSEGNATPYDPKNVVEIALDLQGKDLFFEAGTYTLNHSLIVGLEGRNLICEMGTVIKTGIYDLTIKNAASV